jgi:hypothetical protein
MGAGLHAEGAAAALKNALYLGGDAVAMGTVLPVEGQEIVVLAAKDDVGKAGIFHGGLLMVFFSLYHILRRLSIDL